MLFRSPTAVGLEWFGETHRGKVRTNNEDAFLGLCFNVQEIHRLGKFGEGSTANMDFVFAVSDGMGGAKAGEYASRIATTKISAHLPRSFKRSAEGVAAAFEDVLTELYDDIHSALTYVGSSYEECAGMETTLSLCWFTPRIMYFAHIGDSRIYYLPARSGEIRRLSEDDTHVDWLFRTGQINEREARTHPRRSVLQKALGGTNQFVDPQLGAVVHERGDIFLLCTDGLVDAHYDEQLAERLVETTARGQGFNPARHLVEEAVEKAGRDNTTALIIRVV